MSQSPRVTGIGGVFVKARDGASLGEWYRSHLGIDVQEAGWAVFRWREHQDPAHAGTTVLSMINYCGVCEANTPSR